MGYGAFTHRTPQLWIPGRKPVGGPAKFEINRNDRLAVGLKSCILFGSGAGTASGVDDLANPSQSFTAAGTPVFSNTVMGRACNFGYGYNYYLKYAKSPGATSTWTFSAMVNWPGNDNDYAIVLGGDANIDYLLVGDSDSVNNLGGTKYMLGIYNGTATVDFSPQVNHNNLSGWHRVTTTCDGSSAYLYIDGVYKATATGVSKTANPTYLLGDNGWGTTDVSWPFPVSDIFFWSRCLSADEVSEHFADPYTIIRPRYSEMGFVGAAIATGARYNYTGIGTVATATYLSRGIGAKRVGSASTTKSLLKAITKTIAGSSSTSSIAHKQITTSRFGSSNPLASTTSSRLSYLTTTATGAASAIVSRLIGRATAASGAVASQITRSIGRLSQAVSLTATAASRSMGIKRSGISSGTASIGKGMIITEAGSGVATASTSSSRASFASYAAQAVTSTSLVRATGSIHVGTAAGSGSLLRRTARSLLASGSGVATYILAIALHLSGIASSAASITVIKAHLVSTSALAAGTGLVARGMTKATSATASALGSSMRGISLGLKATVSGVGEILRSIGALVTTSASGAGSASPVLGAHTIQQPLSAQASTATSLNTQRAIQQTAIGSTSASGTIKKALTFSVQALGRGTGKVANAMSYSLLGTSLPTVLIHFQQGRSYQALGRTVSSISSKIATHISAHSAATGTQQVAVSVSSSASAGAVAWMTKGLQTSLLGSAVGKALIATLLAGAAAANNVFQKIMLRRDIRLIKIEPDIRVLPVDRDIRLLAVEPDVRLVTLDHDIRLIVLDKDTSVLKKYSEKAPTDSDNRFGIDVKDNLVEGETLTGVNGITATPNGLTIVSPAYNGTIVSFGVQGGVAGVTYTITIDYKTSLCPSISRSVLLPVEPKV